MKPYAVLALCLLALAACQRKNKEPLYGTLTVKGRVVDEITNAPLPGATVVFTSYRTKTDALGGAVYEPDQEVRAIADADGYYTISYDAKGEKAFDVQAMPVQLTHLNSYLALGSEATRMQSVGSFAFDLPCPPAAYARISLTNVPSVDTPAQVRLTTTPDNLTLIRQWKDTVVFMRLVGNNRSPARVSFSTDDSSTVTPDVTVAPGDTLSMHFSF